jgi:hypothetical protein
LLLPDKFKPLGITKYDAKQDPIQWLRCYALSIENAGGNNDTKCLAWTWPWSSRNKERPYASTCAASSTSALP